jgi:hypothetical protein
LVACGATADVSADAGPASTKTLATKGCADPSLHDHVSCR